LVEFGGRTYRLHSPQASSVLADLFRGFQTEGVGMPFTLEDFNRQYLKENFANLSPGEKAEVLKTVTPEQRLAGLTEEQIQRLLGRFSTKRPTPPRKPRRKK
jgi:hypothetical protein